MIRLPSRPHAPKFFETPEFQALVGDLHAFHLGGGTRKLQRYFPWQERFEPYFEEGRQSLGAWTAGKCAYTEINFVPDDALLLGKARVGTLDRAQVLLHRPPGDATGLDGSISPDHYWWLIPVWENWHLAASKVASVKENRFPVDGERAPIPEVDSGTPEAPDERALLLDPAVDDPVWHLQFSRGGAVGACDVETGASWQSRRLPAQRPLPGVHTIMTLDLNNDALIAARRSVARKAMKEFGELIVGRRNPGAVAQLVSVEQAHAAVARQAAARSLLSRLRVDTEASRAPEDAAVRALIEALPNEIAVLVICPPQKPARFSSEGMQYLLPIAEKLPDEFRPRFLAALGVETGEILADPLEHGSVRTGSGREEPEANAGEADLPRPIVDRSAQVKAIHIRNFKAIHTVDLDTADLADGERTVTLEPAWRSGEQAIEGARRWWTFLGENGSGKSSLIQAIGLALAGERVGEVLEEAELTWGDLHRRTTRGSDEVVEEGRICLDFTNGVRIDLRFDAQGHRWVADTRALADGEAPLPEGSAVPEIQTFVRGYGATRLLESGGAAAARRATSRSGPDGKSQDPFQQTVRIANLLDPRACVIDAENWLLGLSDDDFNVAATTISELLQDARVRSQPDSAGETPRDGQAGAADALVLQRDVETGEVTVEGLPLALVSDGYRAVVAMLSDIMAGLSEGTSSSLGAPGIVLLDEIGAHLHPRWRMSITRKLRRALPQVQFIVSTHEPLCLRGLVAREVVRVKKHPAHGVLTEVLERSPSTYRVDQLLTSEFFGLETTIDPDLERRFHHYYRLLAKPEAERSNEEQADLEELYRYLHEHAQPTLGFTRRDQIISNLVDELLSQEYEAEPPNETREAYEARRREQRAGILDSVRDIWNLRAAAHDLGDVR